MANCGGLPDAIGNAGVSFRHEDAEDAARWIEKLLTPDADFRCYREAAAPHLAKHTAAVVAAQYLQVLEEAAGR